jgi:hypothetical protein
MLALCALLGVSSLASAQSRTWVSGVGNDANPCSRTAPCKTFAGAFSKTAAKGEINVLDPGGFGAVTITKAISIEGEGFTAGIAAGGTNGIIVNAGGSDVVTIRGVTLDGAGTGLNGIRILNASVVHIENCLIQNFVNRGIDVENSAGAVRVFVKDTIIKNNFLGGASPAGNSGAVLIKPSGTGSVIAFFDNVRMDQNEFGLRTENNVKVKARNTTADGNVLFGFIAVSTGTGSVMDLDGGSASFNSTGIRTDGVGAAIRLGRMQVTGNTSFGTQATNSGTISSHQNNGVAGNTTDSSPAMTPIGQQ